jgi:hypothetical protein
LQPRKSLVTFETQIDIILVVLDNLSVDWIGQNKESWDKYTSYSSRSSFICINDERSDFATEKSVSDLWNQ